MLDQTLAAAFIDNGVRHRILGRELRPFSLWHRLLLQTIDSPLLKKGDVHLFHLRRAVGICSLGFPQSKVKPPPSFSLSLIRRGLQGELDAFLAYAGDYLTRPDYNIVPPRTTAPQIPRGAPPEVIQVVADVTSFAHCPEAYVWDMPIGRAFWWQMMAIRAGGADVDYLTEEEKGFQSELADAERSGDLAQTVLRPVESKDQVKGTVCL